MKNGIGSHHSSKMLNDEWLTPPEIIQALGEFDLDPCSPIDRPWDTAKNHYSKNDNGLDCIWFGRIWCNPPYGKETWKWLRKLSNDGNGIALIYARTETDNFFKYVWEKADAILFIKGRLHFYSVKGERAIMNAGGPSCLVAYGKENVKALENSSIGGKLVYLR